MRLLPFLPLAVALHAQQFAPHIGYVYPAGGQRGSTFEVTFGGQFLDGVQSAYVSGAGLEAAVVQLVKPMTQGQFNQLREQLEELQKKRPLSAEDQQKAAEIRMKMAMFIRRPVAPAIAETVTVKIAIAPDAALGEREIRLGSNLGLTNPLVFCVGQLPEFSKPPAKPQGDAPRFRQQPANPKPEPPPLVTLPVTVNGQIMPGGIDRFRFHAAKGQKLVLATTARRLMPYISDGVPGWFQATLALYDSKGREVAYADDYRHQPDPVLYYEIAEDGEYTVEIKDSIYRGREDWVYRISMGELPFITGIFPLGGKAGTKTAVEVNGWNLPAPKIAQSPGMRAVSVRKGEWVSNAAPFAVDSLPELGEQEPNDSIKGVRVVKWPVIVNGRIGKPGDRDVFRFEGRAGEEMVAEVVARRLDSPLDSFLTLTDAAGKQLAANDDYEDKGAGLVTHHADSRLTFKLPKKGAYYVHVSDVQRKGGTEYAYRLRLSRPQPDFDLRVTPSSISARPGAIVPMTVYALRQDGFSGGIALKLRDAPDGFELSGGWIPPGEDKVRLTLAAPATPVDGVVRLNLEGRAPIGGREVRHPAAPAEDMMQAFAYRHLVPAQEWLARVSGPPRFRAPFQAHAGPIKVPAGGSAAARFDLPARRFGGLLRLALNDPPEGIAIESVSGEPDGISVTLRADAAKVKPGLKGNLILEVYLERPANAPVAKKQANNRRQPLGLLPAVPFEIVKK